MRSHAYLRAYVAGLAVPSVVVFIVGIVVMAFFGSIPAQVERAMIFPMAINPAIWGLWNVLYILLPGPWRLPIAWHGAILAVILVPIGVAVARALSISFVTVCGAALVTAPTIIAYYVIWKYIVRFLNELVHASDASNRNGGQS